MASSTREGLRNRQGRKATGTDTVADEAKLAAFVDAAESPRPDEMTVQQRIEKRAQGRYFNATSFRTTEEQKELLKFAAQRSGKSVQQYMEGILMAELERAYGQEFDAQR
ncbi:hypothetical protein ACTXN7_11610 [Corynebacterium flavescens]|uniref:hypothetical protein n=1 Tax=Corynebacterium flavescens TaxID=28028 RepID=UPI003FCF947D